MIGYMHATRTLTDITKQLNAYTYMYTSHTGVIVLNVQCPVLIYLVPKVCGQNFVGVAEFSSVCAIHKCLYNNPSGYIVT